MLKSQKEREGRDPNYVPPEPHFASVPTKPTDEKEEEEKKAKDSEDTKPEDGPDTPAMPTEATDEPASDIPELEPYTDPAAAFKVDDKVKVKDSGKLGKVTGTSRGRVGVLLEGEEQNTSFIPDLIEKVDEKAEDSEDELEPYTDPAAAFKVDDKVKVKETGKLGKVTGTSRGRVGVLLEGEEQNTSFIPDLIEKVDEEKAEDSEDELEPYTDPAAAFKVDDKVKVKETSKLGKVTGTSRGRVGVLLEGEEQNTSFIPDLIEKVDNEKEGIPGEEEAEDELEPYTDPAADFKVDDKVKVKETGKLGKVTGTSRGRVGVLLESEEQNTSFIPDLIEKVDEEKAEDSEDELEPYTDPAAAFKVDDKVKVKETSKLGKVTGTSRGRVGVLLEGEEQNTSFIPDLIEKVDEEKAEDSEDELEPYTDPAAAFKVDDKVKVKETGKYGKVTGTSRGRVGVLLEGEEQNTSFIPDLIEKVDEEKAEGSEDELEPYTDPAAAFKVDDKVKVTEGNFKYRCGTVQGTGRGRVGVLIEGELLGTSFIAVHLEKITDSNKNETPAPESKGEDQEDAEEELEPYTDPAAAFKVDNKVKVKETGKYGKVTGTSRGRVGVLLEGEEQNTSFIPDLIEKVDEEKAEDPEDELEPYTDPAAAFKVDDKVKVKDTGKLGKVTGTSRGRVGVLLEGEEQNTSFIPDLIVKIDEEKAEDSEDELEPYTDPAAAFKVDDKVKVKETGKYGKVTGTSRGRVGVLLEGEEQNTSFIPDLIEKVDEEKKEETRADEQAQDEEEEYDDHSILFEAGDAVKVVETSKLGKVTGRGRGRVGVQLDGEEEPSSYFPNQIVHEDKAPKYNVGDLVTVKDNEGHGEVTGISRGRVGVLLNGETIGCLPTQLAYYVPAPTVLGDLGEKKEEENETPEEKEDPATRPTSAISSSYCSTVKEPEAAKDDSKRPPTSSSVSRSESYSEDEETPKKEKLKEEASPSPSSSYTASETPESSAASPSPTADTTAKKKDAQQAPSSRSSSVSSRSRSSSVGTRSVTPPTPKKVTPVKETPPVAKETPPRRKSSSAANNNNNNNNNKAISPTKRTSRAAAAASNNRRASNGKVFHAGAIRPKTKPGGKAARKDAWEAKQPVDRTKLIQQLKDKNTELNDAVETVQNQLEDMLRRKGQVKAEKAAKKSQEQRMRNLEEEFRLLQLSNEALEKKYREAAREEKMENRLRKLDVLSEQLREDNRKMKQEQRDNEKRLRHYADPEKIHREAVRGFKDEIMVLRATLERMERQRGQSTAHAEFQRKRLQQLAKDDEHPEVTVADIKRSVEISHLIQDANDEKENLEYRLNVLHKQKETYRKTAEMNKAEKEKDEIQALKREIRDARKVLGVEYKSPQPTPKADKDERGSATKPEKKKKEKTSLPALEPSPKKTQTIPQSASVEPVPVLPELTGTNGKTSVVSSTSVTEESVSSASHSPPKEEKKDEDAVSTDDEYDDDFGIPDEKPEPESPKDEKVKDPLPTGTAASPSPVVVEEGDDDEIEEKIESVTQSPKPPTPKAEDELPPLKPLVMHPVPGSTSSASSPKPPSPAPEEEKEKEKEKEEEKPKPQYGYAAKPAPVAEKKTEEPSWLAEEDERQERGTGHRVAEEKKQEKEETPSWLMDDGGSEEKKKEKKSDEPSWLNDAPENEPKPKEETAPKDVPAWMREDDGQGTSSANVKQGSNNDSSPSWLNGSGDDSPKKQETENKPPNGRRVSKEVQPKEELPLWLQ